MKLSSNIPDSVWVEIWALAEPTPVEMGDYRALSRQYQRVMDDNRLWQQYSPRANAEGPSLRDAFINRTETRSVRGNAYLAAVYRQKLMPYIKQEIPVKGGATVEIPSFANSTGRVHALTYEQVSPYLRKGTSGRDDDFDAACAVTAPARFWKDFSPVVCNEAAIVERRVPTRGGILAYVGKQFHTDYLVMQALKNDGEVIDMVAKCYRDDERHAAWAVWSSPKAYSLLDVALQKNYEIAAIHTSRHPERSEETVPFFGVDLSLLSDAYFRGLRLDKQFLENMGSALYNDSGFLRALLRVNTFAVDWVKRFYYNIPDLVQAAWYGYNERQDQERLRILHDVISPRLRTKWHKIDTAEFLLQDDDTAASGGRFANIFRR